MLTRETLVANEALKGLTDEQIETIATLSQNDENTVIGQRFGEAYREMDSTIEKATGIKRDGDEKTYVYLERATKAFADKYKDYGTLKDRIAELEEQVKKGGDEAIKAELATAKAELEATKGQYNTLKTEFDNAKAEHTKALDGIRIDAEISAAKNGLKFKQGFSEQVLNTLIGQAIASVKAKSPAFEERDGKQVLIFHDENGAPLNNPENKLNPFTAHELLAKEFEAMDILEKAPAKGAGGSGNTVSTQATMTGVKTQVEAEETIAKILAEKGIAKTNLKYQEEHDKLWEENKCSDLPVK